MIRDVSKDDTIYDSMRKVIGKNVVNESGSMDVIRVGCEISGRKLWENIQSRNSLVEECC